MKVGSVEKLSAVGFNRVTGLFKPAVVHSYVTTHGKAWQKPLILKPGKWSEKFFAYVFQQPNSIVASQTKYEVTTKQMSVGKSQVLSSRCLLANLKYYQADVCWQISNTIKQKSVGKSQILSSRCLLANLKYYQADDVNLGFESEFKFLSND